MVLLLWWQIVLLFNKKCSSTCYHGIWHHNISTNWCHNSSTMTTCNRKHSWLSCIQQQILFKILRIVLTCINTILITIHYCHKVRGQGPRSLSEQDWILMDVILLNCEYNFNTRGRHTKVQSLTKHQVSPHVLFTPTDQDVVVVLPWLQPLILLLSLPHDRWCVQCLRP